MIQKLIEICLKKDEFERFKNCENPLEKYCLNNLECIQLKELEFT